MAADSTDVANVTSAHGMGIEMELPLSVRNPYITRGWTESFDDYVAAGQQFGFDRALKTYYYGNDFVVMASNSSVDTRAHYEALYGVVKGSRAHAD